jgi:hypothetical protein
MHLVFLCRTREQNQPNATNAPEFSQPFHARKLFCADDVASNVAFDGDLDLQVVIGRLAIALDHIVRNARGQVGDPDLAVLRRAAVGAVLVLAEHFFAARCRRLLAKRDLIRDRILALRSSRPLAIAAATRRSSTLSSISRNCPSRIILPAMVAKLVMVLSRAPSAVVARSLTIAAKLRGERT